MASMFVFGALLTLLFGGMMLALVMGYLETEKKREQEERARMTEAVPVGQAVASVPRFFADLDRVQSPPAPDTADDGYVSQLEGYLMAEQALVARFVKEPSIDNLYREASVSPVVH
jgi:hypothetical protein